MPADVKRELHLEIAHILFIDTVGYSKRPINEQRELCDMLNKIVRNTNQFRAAEAAGKLIRLPTGDGMALVFSDPPEAPVECAMEVSKALRDYPQLHLRMGIHSGPVSRVVDVNDRSNVAGAGINTAERVMACADAGHILLSKRAADDLAEYEHLRPHLHELGECESKHGAKLSVVNFYTGELGNPELPTKFKLAKQKAAEEASLSRSTFTDQHNLLPLIAAILAIVAVIAACYFFFQRATRKVATGSSTIPGLRELAVIPEKSIAVLPFENLSDEKQNAYFAAGIRDEILTRLANLKELKVISRTSTEKYKSHPDNLKAVAAELGVTNILEGSVQKLANEVHINVQLIKAATDAHMWAQSFDRTLEHAFAVEGEVAQMVADALKVTLLPAQIAKLNELPTQNAQAYDLYLKGDYELHRAWESEELSSIAKKAAEHYRQAIKIDPQFSPAYASLARAELLEYHFRLDFEQAERKPELADDAKQNIDRALTLTPDLAVAHLALGEWHYWCHRDYPKAIAELQRAINLDPHLSDAFNRIANIRQRQGQPEKVPGELQVALEFDPRNEIIHRNIAVSYRALRKYELASDRFARAIALAPHDTADIANLALTFEDRGDLEAAARTLESYPADQRSGSVFMEEKFRLLQLSRDYRGTEEFLKNFPPSAFATAWILPTMMGQVARELGRMEEARTSFEEARMALEAAIAKDPNESRTHANLGWVDAELGRADEAIREAQRAVELDAQRHDFYAGGASLENLAEVYAKLGRTEDALKVLDQLFSTPTGEYISVALLKLDPVWDNIRGDPRFQQFIVSAEKKPN
jgi:TolB-like protein/Tfp pilus assembly protein PilF/class 3 adenylate cyclase